MPAVLDEKLKLEDVKWLQKDYTLTEVELEVYSQAGGSIQ